MAEFTGTGAFTMASGKLHDILFSGSGAVTLSCDARGITSPTSPVEMQSGSLVDSSVGADLLVSGDAVHIDNVRCGQVNVTGSKCDLTLRSDSSGGYGVTIAGNLNRLRAYVDAADEHGVVISGDDNNVSVVVDGSGTATTDTYDNVHITGNRNYLHGSLLRPRATAPLTRYGANIASGDCNRVVGNDLGDPLDYGTDALNDAGTNTQLTYPNDPTYGDNFTDCVTSS